MMHWSPWDWCETGVLIARVFIHSAVEIDGDLVRWPAAEDQIPVRLLVAIHAILIELWPAQPSEAPVPPMPHEPVSHRLFSLVDSTERRVVRSTTYA